MSDPTSTPPEAPAKPKRRTAPAVKVLPPEQFFTEMIQGLLGDGGVAGAFSNSSIEMMANPANAVKWYAAYLVLCENYARVMSGELKVSPKQFPAGIREKVAQLIGSD